MKRSILTASTHPGSAGATCPVIKELKKRDFEIIPVVNGPAEKIFERERIPFKNLRYYGVSDVSPVSMDKIIKEISPDFVLSGVSFQEERFPYTAEQTATFKARAEGISCLNITDFWEEDWGKRFRDIHTKEEFVYVPDMLTAIDETSKQEILAQGIPIPEEKIFPTGNPNFDQLSVMATKFSEEEKRKVKRDLRFNENSVLIVYANQGIEAEFGNHWGFNERTGLWDLLRGLKTLPKHLNLSLLIKQHPRHPLEALVQNLEKFKEKEGFDIPVLVNKDYDTQKAVFASDITVSHYSTILVEAALAGKPAISLQPGLYDISKDLLRTNKYGLTLPIYEKGKVGNYIKEILTDKDFSERLKEKREKFCDGKATERIVKIIEQNIE